MNFLSNLSLLFFLLIVGCGDDNVYDADFQGTILEVKEDSILVSEDDINPESTYPVYEIMINKSTKFSGEVERYKDLDNFISQIEQPVVHLWVIDKGENNEIDNRIAREVIVEKE
ncbi:hypothetical protein E3U55_12385 [Filobacillus milosensis]|uniref:DUF3221 domain-containing protein n=1 Tax=Filobacillus milosensis TaxID=94137 RepID=A0A4Y8IER9_9BACI|nr:hypothetical protein [Filobacillus milosensis]TFB15044.1 hypothetical protein E3U55_12385 [Filobacillus milosensis]